jgi:hypothetical protein
MRAAQLKETEMNENNNMSEGPQEVIQQLRTLAHEHLFGGGPWFARGEVYDALSRKVDEMGLWEPDPDGVMRPSPLGATVNVELMTIFLEHDIWGEVPMTLEAHGLMMEQEVDEVYEIYITTAWQHAEIIGAEPDDSNSLLPFVRRAFLEFFKQRPVN